MNRASDLLQERLLGYPNPLPSRLGAEFFKGVPRQAGVYFLYGENETLLYVGKAKDLRNRLASYKRVRPENASRKVLRMIHLVRSIRWETCGSEKEALLLENRLLREHRPPFNVVNTRPESYYFIGFIYDRGFFRFLLTTNPEEDELPLYGVYKGRGSVRGGFGALLRLMWAASIRNESGRVDLPTRLFKHIPPYRHSVQLPRDFPVEELIIWESAIKRFLNGTSDTLLKVLTGLLLTNEAIPKFLYRAVQEDLLELAEFYERGPRRNSGIRRKLKIRKKLIAQEQIDDLLVLCRE